MSKETENISIFAKKYYRVVLDSVDKSRETTESFALKMSMRLRTPLPRAMAILRHLPCTIKSGINIAQANKLFAVMEDLGGKAKVESYFLTPGEDSHGGSSIKRSGDLVLKKCRCVACPKCGWENEINAAYCAMCLTSFFRKKEAGELDHPDSGGAKDSLFEIKETSVSQAGKQADVMSFISGLPRGWLIMAALIILLLVIIIKK